MDEEDGAQHDNDDGCRADSEQSAEQDGEASGKLGQTDEIADDVRGVHEGGEVVGAGAAESAEENGGAVVDEGKGAGDAHDQEFEIEFADGAGGEGVGDSHGNTSLLRCERCIKRTQKKPREIRTCSRL